MKPKVEAAKPANEQSSVIGQDTQISWKFSGIEKPQVTWLLNGQPLPTNERFQITETEDGTSTLAIRAAELTDKDVDLIKQVLSSNAENKSIIIEKLTHKLKSNLNIESTLNYNQFLITILKDFNHLNGKL